MVQLEIRQNCPKSTFSPKKIRSLAAETILNCLARIIKE